MKTKKLAVVLTVLALISGGIVLASEDPAPQEISNTRLANVMVKISCDPEIFPLSPHMVGNLVLNYGVAGKPATEILKISPDDIYERLSVDTLQGHTEIEQLKKGRRRNLRELDEDDEEAFYDERALLEMQLLGRKKQSKAIEAKLSTKIWHSLLLRLKVDVRETDARPAAEEFMAVVVKNLRRTLERAYKHQRSLLDFDLSRAYDSREKAERDLHEVAGIHIETEADIAVKKQLEQVVELPNLDPGMGFGDALDSLRNSVTPPLRISVMWRALVDYDIDQSTAINMDPISSAPVGTALKLLLNSISAGVAEMRYVVKDGIIVIATAANFPAPQQMLLQLEQTSLPREVLLERKKQLFIEMQHEELNVATEQAQRLAYEERIAEVQHQIAEKLRDDPVTKELENLIKQHEVHLENLRSLQKMGKIGATDIAAVEEKLAQSRIQLAERQEQVSQNAGAHQIADYRSQLAQSAVNLAIRKAGMEVRQKQLNETENQLKGASAVSPNALRMRLATEALEQAEHRVNELKIRIGALRSPTVIVIGAD
jgi:hypothetical protein